MINKLKDKTVQAKHTYHLSNAPTAFNVDGSQLLQYSQQFVQKYKEANQICISNEAGNLLANSKWFLGSSSNNNSYIHISIHHKVITSETKSPKDLLHFDYHGVHYANHQYPLGKCLCATGPMNASSAVHYELFMKGSCIITYLSQKNNKTHQTMWCQQWQCISEAVCCSHYQTLHQVPKMLAATQMQWHQQQCHTHKLHLISENCQSTFLCATLDLQDMQRLL